MALVRNKTEREPRVLAVVVRPARNTFRAAVCARRVES